MDGFLKAVEGLAAQVEAGTAKPETIHRFLISAERDIDKLISLQNHPAAETLRRFAVEAGTGYNRPIMMRSEEHTSELQSLMRISYAVFCLKKKNTKRYKLTKHTNNASQNTMWNK